MDFNNFNKEQQNAIAHGDGPLLIVAGAGTGKTMAITQRIARLIMDKKLKPEQILAVTFTEKAAEEMEERIDKLLPYGVFDKWILTFHSFADKILRQHGLDMGLPVDYKLLDQTGQWLLIKKNFDRFNLDYYRPLGNPNKYIHALLKHFSRCKDELISPQQYLDYAEEIKLNTDSSDFVQKLDLENLSASERKEAAKQEIMRVAEVADAYHRYQQLLLENECLDFGDLINYAIDLLKKRPKILNEFRKQFKYILVDEFQDTNTAQYELIKLLAAPKNNLTVVGDDDQSIYRFRGASVSNIMQFKDDFPDAQEVVLTKNYRTCQQILDKAYDFIQLNNPDRLEEKLKINKKLESQKADKCEIEYWHAQNQQDQAEMIIRKMIELKSIDREADWDDFAILVRSNDSGEIFNNLLEQANIPHQFLSLKGLYSKPVILDVFAYFNLLDNYHEGAALYKVLTSVWLGIKEQDVIKLVYLAKRQNKSLFELLKQIDLIKELDAQTNERVKKLFSLVEKHTQLAQKEKTSKVFISFLYDSGYIDYLKNNENKENQLSLSYLQTLHKKIQEFEKEDPEVKLADFKQLIQLELSAGELGTVDVDLDAGPEMVKIMTVHGSKGLEFKYVFIPDLVDRKFPPDKRSEAIEIPDALLKIHLAEGDVHIQEERRLFYVAMTRAKQGLYFSSAQNFGSAQKRKPSRFLIELGYAAKAPEKSPEIERKPEKAKEEFFYEVPKRFSHSQLSAYETCPYKYKLANVLKIPTFGKFQFTFGDNIHRTLNQFLTEYYSIRPSMQKDLFGNDMLPDSKKPGFDDLLAMYEKNWKSDWFEDKKQEKDYFEKGKVALNNFFQDFEKQKPDVWVLERPFTIKVGNYTVSGRIDRVDKSGPDTVEIIDYKTGQAKDKLDTSDRKQLLLYQIAVEEGLGKKVSNLVYYYLEYDKKISFVGKEKDKEKLKEKILDQIAKIQALEFDATPNPHICQFCDYKEICEYKRL
ncbi:MAG: ATP-dependent helicase [Patescibacteria group bacterium]